jgi:hypothetical protein
VQRRRFLVNAAFTPAALPASALRWLTSPPAGASAAQLTAWLAEVGVPASPVRALPVGEVAPRVLAQRPVAGLDEQVRELHRQFRLPQMRLKSLASLCATTGSAA